MLTSKSKKLLVPLLCLVLVLGMCPVAFAVEGDLSAARSVAQYEKLFSNCTVNHKTRIAEGSKNLNPIKSVKSPTGATLKADTDYTIKYFSADNYGDETMQLSSVPSEPGRYIAMLYPVDTDAYIGMYAAHYQITGEDFVERVVTESQKSDVTSYLSSSDATYYRVYDSQTPWLHYTKSESQYNDWIEAGYQYYGKYFSDDSIFYFMQDPNNGRYCIEPYYYNYESRAYTSKGLTYNMELCVAVAEASYTLNKGCDVVSDDEGYDVAKTKTWVSTESYTALKTAIANAEEVGTTKGASSNKVKAAKKQLNKALKAFVPATGKKGQKRNIAKAKVTKIVSKSYTGKAIAQTPVVTFNGKTLVAGKHYTVSYKNAKGKAIKAKNVKAAGTYTVVIKGKGTCKGKISKSFKIKAVSVKAKTVKISKIKAQKLKKVGTPVKPKVTVKFGTTKLKANRDYTVTYKNNAKKGTAQVIVKGKGNFTGKKAVKFTIK